jgi:hypothetical protein
MGAQQATAESGESRSAVILIAVNVSTTVDACQEEADSRKPTRRPGGPFIYGIVKDGSLHESER